MLSMASLIEGRETEARGSILPSSTKILPRTTRKTESIGLSGVGQISRMSERHHSGDKSTPFYRNLSNLLAYEMVIPALCIWPASSISDVGNGEIKVLQEYSETSR